MLAQRRGPARGMICPGLSERPGWKTTGDDCFGIARPAPQESARLPEAPFTLDQRPRWEHDAAITRRDTRPDWARLSNRSSDEPGRLSAGGRDRRAGWHHHRRHEDGIRHLRRDRS